jgi:galactose mutarotase-like enzyme
LFAYETAGATTCTLHSNKTSHSVAITYDNMPYLCVWSPTPKDAPFVCIEPWVGLPDNTNATGKLNEKFAIQKLEALTNSKTGFTITIK